LRITSPEPVPAPLAPWAPIVTIDGSVRLATVVAAQTDPFSEVCVVAHTISPPTTPPITAVAAAATHNHQRRAFISARGAGWSHPRCRPQPPHRTT
jgi:hypothetical protein